MTPSDPANTFAAHALEDVSERLGDRWRTPPANLHSTQALSPRFVAQRIADQTQLAERIRSAALRAREEATGSRVDAQVNRRAIVELQALDEVYGLLKLVVAADGRIQGLRSFRSKVTPGISALETREADLRNRRASNLPEPLAIRAAAVLDQAILHDRRYQANVMANQLAALRRCESVGDVKRLMSAISSRSEEVVRAAEANRLAADQWQEVEQAEAYLGQSDVDLEQLQHYGEALTDAWRQFRHSVVGKEMVTFFGSGASDLELDDFAELVIETKSAGLSHQRTQGELSGPGG